jgi:hypothetical protein
MDPFLHFGLNHLQILKIIKIHENDVHFFPISLIKPFEDPIVKFSFPPHSKNCNPDSGI